MPLVLSEAVKEVAFLFGSTESRSMSCVALDGRALATYCCYMQSMLFYCRFSRKCDATERLMLFSGGPKFKLSIRRLCPI